MRRLLALLSLFVLSAAAAVAGVAAPPAAAVAQTICSNQPVPAGWVVTRVFTSLNCSAGGANAGGASWLAYTLQQPVNDIWICGLHGAPAGWAIVQTVTTGSNCRTSTASWPSHRIRRL